MRGRRKKYRGVAVSAGIGMGVARVLQQGTVRIAETAISAGKVNSEITALDNAVSKAMDELGQLRESAGRRMSGPVAKIFDAQLLIAGDNEFLGQVKEQIKLRKRNAAFVYNMLVQEATFPLKNSPDKYIQQMANDIEAVSRKVLSHLSGSSAAPKMKFPENSILVSNSFSPGDVLAFRNRKAVGFLSGQGGRNSHMALIARSLLVPVVVLEEGWRNIHSDDRLIVDGTRGEVVVNPNDDEWIEYQKIRKRQGPALITRIKKLDTIPPITADGVPITVAANLELPGPVDDILSAQNIPVGLYRTEFLYLERESFPSESDQYHYFCNIAEKFAGSHAVIRIYDLGADKVLNNSPQFDEENPALGWRGIRAMLDMQDIFRGQIRAILRASTNKNLKMLLPMISDVSELEQSKKIIAQEMFGLKKEGIAFDENIEVGIMIEVPAAALMADRMAKKADFVSIGTNDLTQYTMSADRNNRKVAALYQYLHPSVLKMIKMTVDACRKHSTPVSICGEASGDVVAVPLFIGLGINYLSMNPQKIVDVSRMIKKIDSQMVKRMVSSVLTAETVAQVTRRLESYRTALENK